MAAILKGLNSAQKSAVTSSAHVLQILAPPGSGKTKTLTSRVAHLIHQHDFNPQNVICCTFTIKAAREMRQRLRALIGAQLEARLILGTFHSICRRYLIRYGHLIDIPSNFGIADEDDRRAILKRLIKEHNLSIDAQIAKSRISFRKAQGRRLEDLKKGSQKTVEERDFLTIFTEYEASLAKSNLLDYDDLLLRCIDLLSAFPHCVRNVEALLIDEFQDTNIVQFELMKLFSQASNRITIVGDPDQSIYGFRAAQIENLHRMRAVYPDTIVINLEENYRSSSAILRFAQGVIEQDSARPDKKLRATHCYGTLPTLRKLSNPHEEALWIVAEIRRTMAATGNLLSYADFAILLRSAALSLKIEKALTAQGIPYRMVGGFKFFDRKEIRLLINYMRTIHSPENDSALLAVLNVPSRKLGEKSVEAIRTIAEKNSISVWSAIREISSGSLRLQKNLSQAAARNLQTFVKLIENGRKCMSGAAPEQTPRIVIEYVVSGITLKEYLKAEYAEDYEDRWENVQELINQAMDTIEIYKMAHQDILPEVEGIQQREVTSSLDVLGQFLANIVLTSEIETSEEEQLQPRVTISTMHSAKGLEWPIVFIPATYENSIPHSRAEDTDEERRVFYVAITRAQALLTLTFPLMQSNDMGESILSQFLPPIVHPKCSPSGPNFSDKVVNDIAAILRRPVPAQEELIKSRQALTDKGSMNDDLWPLDGSRRRFDACPEDDLLQMRSLLKSNTFSYNSTGLEQVGPGFYRRFSSMAGNKLYNTRTLSEQISSKNGAVPPISSERLSFTTASVQYQHDQFSKKVSIDEHPASIEKAATQLHKKAVDASQGTLANWFTSGTFKAKSMDATALTRRTIPATPKRAASTARFSEEPALLRWEGTDESFLKGLETHRLPSDKTSLLPPHRKRPAQPLTDSPPSKKNAYVFLSSSPTFEAIDGNRVAGLKNICLLGNAPLVTSLPLQETENNYPSLPPSEIIQCSDGVIQPTSTKPASTFHTTSMSLIKKQEGQLTSRRTLGVRRTMNGWDARKIR